MTQKHIHKQAGWGWLRRSYYRLHEPRIVSAIYGAIYTLALVVGAYNFFDPPRTIVEAADNPWLLWIALAAMTVGGALGVITVVNGRYWVERYAATLVAGGLGIYWIISAWLTIFSGGSRILSLFTTTLAIVCVVLRFYWINDRPYNPRRQRT
jgi:hypothetical protein